MTLTRPHGGVIGGGVAGLATWRLEHPDGAASAGRPTSPSTRPAPEVGGNLRTLRDDGEYRSSGAPTASWTANRPPSSSPTASASRDQLVRSATPPARRFLYVRGKLREIPTSPGAFLARTCFSGGQAARARRGPGPGRRDLGPAAEASHRRDRLGLRRRRLGREFADTMLDPMVKGITGGECRRVSLAAAFPRMVELEHDHGGLFRAMIALGASGAVKGKEPRGGAGGPSGVLTSFRGGMQSLPRALADGLRGPVLTGQPSAACTRTTRAGG